MFFCVAASPEGLPVGPVVSFMVPGAAGALDVPPVELCASANVLAIAKAEASAIVLSFMVISSRFVLGNNRHDARMFFARLKRDRSCQAARMRVLTRRQSSSIADPSRLVTVGVLAHRRTVRRSFFRGITTAGVVHP
jgi:hypothetical protein